MAKVSRSTKHADPRYDAPEPAPKSEPTPLAGTLQTPDDTTRPDNVARAEAAAAAAAKKSGGKQKK